MSRRALALAVAAVLFVAATLALVVAGGGGARSSVLSRDPEGWAGLRRYAEARGTGVALLDRPLADAAPGRGTLVLAFPWQHAAWDPAAPAAVRRHLTAGGHLLVAYSGRGGLAEALVLSELGLDLAPARPAPPLAPLAWRRHVTEVWRLPPEGPAATARPLALPAADRVPEAPEGAQVLYRSPRGRPVVFGEIRGASRVLVVPAAALANARLPLPGNADLAETLVQTLPAPWSFDELHHGLVAAGSAETTAAQGRVLDLVLAQLLVLYLLTVVTLGRRFGPPWREAPVVTGSTGAFFLGLGALHHRLGHHGEAARQLIGRSAGLDRTLEVPEALRRRAEAGVDAQGLLEIARELAARRHGP